MARKSSRRIKEHAYSPRDIGESLVVRRGTSVRMLEYDLTRCPNFLCFGNQWGKLLDGWLEQGVKVEAYLQAPSRDAKKLFTEFLAKYPASFAVYLFGDIDNSDLGFNKEQLVRQHFTLVEEPTKQLWVEKDHAPGQGTMRGCGSYQKKGFALGKKREKWEETYENYENVLNRIKRKIKPQKNGGARVVVRR